MFAEKLEQHPLADWFPEFSAVSTTDRTRTRALLLHGGLGWRDCDGNSGGRGWSGAVTDAGSLNRCLFCCICSPVPCLRSAPLCSVRRFSQVGSNSYEAAVGWIREQFECRNLDPASKTIYTHITCATDTSNVTAVFSAVKDIILRKNLGKVRQPRGHGSMRARVDGFWRAREWCCESEWWRLITCSFCVLVRVHLRWLFFCLFFFFPQQGWSLVKKKTARRALLFFSAFTFFFPVLVTPLVLSCLASRLPLSSSFVSISPPSLSRMDVIAIPSPLSTPSSPFPFFTHVHAACLRCDRPLLLSHRTLPVPHTVIIRLCLPFFFFFFCLSNFLLFSFSPLASLSPSSRRLLCRPPCVCSSAFFAPRLQQAVTTTKKYKIPCTLSN